MTRTPIDGMAWWSIGLRGMTGRSIVRVPDSIVFIALICQRPGLISVSGVDRLKGVAAVKLHHRLLAWSDGFSQDLSDRSR